jgi:hypothetical protein
MKRGPGEFGYGLRAAPREFVGGTSLNRGSFVAQRTHRVSARGLPRVTGRQFGIRAMALCHSWTRRYLCCCPSRPSRPRLEKLGNTERSGREPGFACTATGLATGFWLPASGRLPRLPTLASHSPASELVSGSMGQAVRGAMVASTPLICRRTSVLIHRIELLFRAVRHAS